MLGATVDEDQLEMTAMIATRVLGSVALALAGSALAAVDVLQADIPRVEELIHALPDTAVVAARETQPPTTSLELAPGVHVEPGTHLVLHGAMEVDQGPTDGLEVLVSLAGGKTHEALIVLPDDNGELLKGAITVALDLPDGIPAVEGSGVPAIGWPVAVEVYWQPDPAFAPNRWVSRHASELVHSRTTNRAYPALPYVYTGSRFDVVEVTVPGGETVRRNRFMLSNTRSLVVNYDEPDALLASPFPLSAVDMQFEVAHSDVPATGTALRVVFSRANLPLVLNLRASSLIHGETELSADALAELLAATFAEPAPGTLHAVAIQVPDGTAAPALLQAREHVLAAAGAAGVWAVPVFVPAVSP